MTKLDPANNNNFMFSKSVIDLDLSRYNSINELINYINNKDVDLNKIKIIIKKANRELRISGRQLFIRKASKKDKEAKNRICITRR